MKRFIITASLILGLGLTLALLWWLTISGTGLPVVHAAELRVCPSGCPYSSVQAAVDAASTGDVIKVAAGSYTGVSTRAGVTQTVYISKSITIQGGYTTTNWTTPYPITQPTTLDAQGQGRVLYITGDISPTIEGLRITGGDAAGLGGVEFGFRDAGGGVYIISATATMRNNLVFSNTARYGGGLFLRSSASMLSSNTITANSAQCAFCTGGGLYLWLSAATLNRNTISFNTAYYVGGLALSSSPAVVIGNTIITNSAGFGTGGVSVGGSATILDGNIVAGNTTNFGRGGGFTVGSGQPILSRNVIIGNVAIQQDGGGIYLLYSDATLIGNTVISNTGGGMLLEGGAPTLVNNLVADNTGVGIVIGLSAPRLMHTTIARNISGNGSGVYVGYSTVALTNTVLVSQSVGINVEAGSTATLEGTLWGTGAWANGKNWGGAGTILTGTVNVFGDPGFISPNSGNYHITATSAAVNIGVNAGVTTDIDGEPRPYGAGHDIGADEYVPPGAFKYIYLPVVLKNHP